MRILLIEDELEMATWLVRALKQSHIAVEHAATAAMGSALLHDDAFDAVVLDLQLPDQHGFDWLSAIRSQGHRVPVLVLTAQGAVQDRIEGLHRGADDYLTKPFDVAELEARLAALHRRSQGRVQSVVQCGSLSYDSNHGMFRLAGIVLALTPREHSALEMLMARLDVPVSKARLSAKVFPQDSNVGPDAIEQVLHRLRRKLEDSDVHILTVRGLGYMLEAIKPTPTGDAL